MRKQEGRLLPYDWSGKLMRVTIPNPRWSGFTGRSMQEENTAESLTGTEVVLQQMDGSPRWTSCEFPVVNPLHMYRGPTRFIWYLASNLTSRNDTFLPTIVKLDTWTNSTIAWSRTHAAPVSPMFVRLFCLIF